MKLKLISQGTLHYLWSVDLSKRFSRLILSNFIFSQYFLQYLRMGEKCGVAARILYRDSWTFTYTDRMLCQEWMLISTKTFSRMYVNFLGQPMQLDLICISNLFCSILWFSLRTFFSIKWIFTIHPLWWS